MRILVCGGRDYTDRDFVFNTLYNICDEFNLWTPADEYGNTLPAPVTIIEGAARGADSIAGDWAVVNWTGLEEYPADWEKHGKKAGYLRNVEMLEKGKPDLVVSFPGGEGTRMMIELAKEKGIEVREYGKDNVDV